MGGVSITDEAGACFIMQYNDFGLCSHAGNKPARMSLAQLLTFINWNYSQPSRISLLRNIHWQKCTYKVLHARITAHVVENEFTGC